MNRQGTSINKLQLRRETNMNELEQLIVFQLSYTRPPQTRSCLLPTHNIVNKQFIWFQGNSSNLRP